MSTADLTEELDETTEADETDRSKMSFLEHLEELRKRIIHALYAILGSFALMFWFMKDMNDYMLRYFTTSASPAPGVKVTLLASQLTEGFMFQFKLALLAATVLAAPFVLMQLWLFIAPGLYAKEKKVVIPFVASATLLFGTGVWFAHTYAFPAMVKFFVSFGNEYLTSMPSLGLVFGFYVKTVLALGIVFEMPVLVFFMARFGIITAGFMLKKMKYAILIIFIIAALITPSPDPVNQLMFAAPMFILYLVSIGVAWLFGKKKKPATI